MNCGKLPKAVVYENGSLFILDQRKLPFEENMEEQKNVEDVWASIAKLKVRGAPAIGIAAAYGVIVGMKDFFSLPVDEFKNIVSRRAIYLDSSRPTAVNLSKALQRMNTLAVNYSGDSSEELFRLLEKEAENIYLEDAEICRKIGLYGKSLLKNGDKVLTHCNAGALAASERGTALAPVYAAYEDGINVKVYADETRPLLQGARLTAWELQRFGVDVTLICDSMAAYVMSRGMVDSVIVGCDRVAANGDTANKIGTLSVALAAKYFKIPFYVACPSSTYDFNSKTGKDIVIEERASNEITSFAGVRTAPENIKAFNPAFDVTPAGLITAFITEKGIISKPYDINLAKLFKEGCML